MSVANVAANSVATSAWANSVADEVNGILDDIYVAGVLSIPWANVTGKPASFAPSAHAASHATAGSDPVTPAAIGAPISVNTPSTVAGGRRIFVGTAAPGGTISEGDIWVKG